MKAVVEGIGGYCSFGAESEVWMLLWRCTYTAAESEAKKFFCEGLEAVALLELSQEHGSCCGGIGGCCSTGAELEEWMLFWSELETVFQLELNLEHGRTESEAWDDHFWSEQEAAVLLELDLKDENSPGMKWRLIETVSEARRFSRNRLGAVVLLRPNLNMAVSLEQTRSCGLY
uniref:Uncharacterized protein n=1 Tax=Strongyloides stercoralis TaxID=6248 RepID=A0A0K0E573_STRER